MATSDWSVTKLRLWAFVEVPLPSYNGPFIAGSPLPGGVVEYPSRGPLIPRSYTEVIPLDISSFQSDWDLNGIPSGSVQVAVGRRADNPSIVSGIHDLVDDMRVLLRCQVWMHVMERSNHFADGFALDPWPDSPFVCFDGYVCGTGFRKARSVSGNEAGFRLDLIHWLSDLSFSSSLSRTSHQLNPAQFSFPAAFHAGAGALPRFVSATLSLYHFATNQVVTDFWGLSLMPWMKELCAFDRFNVKEVPEIASNPIRGSNYEALRALNRIEPFNITAAVNEGQLPRYEYGVPMALDRGTLAGDAAARTMSNSVSRETVDSMASSTLWDKLTSQYAPNYQFSIVPMVDRALIVPVVPGLRTWTKTIFSEEQDAIQITAKLPRPLRGVGLFTGRGSAAGGLASRPGTVPVDPALTQTIGGYYENREQRGGLVLLKRGPDWLTNLAVPYIWGTDATAPNAIKGTASNPGAGTVPTRPRPTELQDDASHLWQMYARSLYITEVLKGRGGTISSRLRFDVAPGSSVRVITAREKFVAAELDAPETESTFGTVVRVSIRADSESCQAGTVYHVGYTRTAAENVSPSFSISRHPLWTNRWAGAPLVGNHPEFRSPATGGRMIGMDDPEGLANPANVGAILPI